MKKNKFFCLVLFFLALSSFRPTVPCPLEYTGIYVFKLDNESSAVLRFYEDGTVIASTSVNSYKKVMTWFNKENVDMVLSGKYKAKAGKKKCSLKFKVKGMTGEQEYDGTAEGQSLNFQLKDGKSKATTQRIYTFIKM